MIFCLLRDFGRPQPLSRACGCVAEPYGFSSLSLKMKNPLLLERIYSFFGDPDGIRTRVTAVKGRCLRPLDHRAKKNGGCNWIRTNDTPGMNRML